MINEILSYEKDNTRFNTKHFEIWYENNVTNHVLFYFALFIFYFSLFLSEMWSVYFLTGVVRGT